MAHPAWSQLVRIVAASGRADFVKTQGVLWIVPSRILIGFSLLFPIGGGIQALLTFCTGDMDPSHTSVIGACVLLRCIDVALGVSFVCGLGVRLAAIPKIIISHVLTPVT